MKWIWSVFQVQISFAIHNITIVTLWVTYFWLHFTGAILIFLLTDPMSFSFFCNFIWILLISRSLLVMVINILCYLCVSYCIFLLITQFTLVKFLCIFASVILQFHNVKQCFFAGRLFNCEFNWCKMCTNCNYNYVQC